MPKHVSTAFGVDVSVAALDGRRTVRVRLLAGTGAMWTWVPAEVLERAGIFPAGVARFRALDGRVVGRPYADARIACGNRDASSLFVFAAEGDQNTLGDHALLCLGVETDPETQSLRESGPALALAAA